MRRSILLAVSLVFLLCVPVRSSSAGDPLSGLDLGDLMKVKVTSLQRREGELRRTAAPVYVVTAEEIRRSGATSVPDVLRLVPGLHVARVNGNTWAISARGFNSSTSNKLLVLVDGRSVYSPLFAGVFWDIQDIPLDSIERIEVIRGPGGALWGANAVNGIINIIRKPAAERAGTSASVTVGDEDRFIGEVSQGGSIGEANAVAFGRYREFDSLRTVGGGDNEDEGRFGTGGFRVDGGDAGASWMLSGDGYAGEFGENRTVFSLNPPSTTPANVRTDVNGGNLTGQLRKRIGDGYLALRTFFDRSERRIPRFFHEVRKTFDTEIQHEVEPVRRHRLTYGAGYRETTDRVGSTLSITWDPSAETDRIFSFFFQDQMQFTARSFVEAGAKLERNDYSGWETQPNARFGFQPNPNHLIWTAVSRAVRTPTRFDRDVSFPGILLPGPTILEGQGSDNFDSEKLLAYEAGYRAQPTSRLYMSYTGFYNRYDDLKTFEPAPPESRTLPSPHTALPFMAENQAWGESFGGEMVQRLQLLPWWRLEAQYSYLHLRIHLNEGSADFTTVPSERNDPQHQARLMSHWNVGDRWEFDAIVRWVDDLKALRVDDYTALDLRAGWSVNSDVRVELAGRNLFETSHREFSGAAEVEPSVHGKVSCTFR